MRSQTCAGQQNAAAGKQTCSRETPNLVAAASSTTTAAASTAVAAAIPATASTIAPAASSMFGFGTCLIHVETAPAHLRAVQCCDGLVSIFVAGHFHETESPRASRVSVRHDAHPVHLPERFKHLAQFILGSVEAQIADKNILQASPLH